MPRQQLFEDYDACKIGCEIVGMTFPARQEGWPRVAPAFSLVHELVHDDAVVQWYRGS